MQFQWNILGGGQSFRLYKSQMLTGCGDKLIADDLVSGVLQHNRPLSVKTFACSIVHKTSETVLMLISVRVRHQRWPKPGALETIHLFNKQFGLIIKIYPDSWTGFTGILRHRHLRMWSRIIVAVAHPPWVTDGILTCLGRSPRSCRSPRLITAAAFFIRLHA